MKDPQELLLEEIYMKHPQELLLEEIYMKVLQCAFEHRYTDKRVVVYMHKEIFDLLTAFVNSQQGQISQIIYEQKLCSCIAGADIYVTCETPWNKKPAPKYAVVAV